MKRLLLVASHLLALAVGFAAGVYVLPILIATDARRSSSRASRPPRVDSHLPRDLNTSIPSLGQGHCTNRSEELTWPLARAGR